MADVVKQPRKGHEFDVAISAFMGVSVKQLACPGSSEVHDPDCMCESCVLCASVHESGAPELLYVTQALKPGRVEEGLRQGRELNVSVDRIVRKL